MIGIRRRVLSDYGDGADYRGRPFWRGRQRHRDQTY